jgi:hypothetical protein
LPFNDDFATPLSSVVQIILRTKMENLSSLKLKKTGGQVAFLRK